MKQSLQITQALANLKIEELNPMQEASIDTWSEGKDLILLSPTGSGKTLAYLLPLLDSLNPEIKGVQAVVLVPSRELALHKACILSALSTISYPMTHEVEFLVPFFSCAFFLARYNLMNLHLLSRIC